MTQPIYNNADLIDMADKAKKKSVYYQDRYKKMEKERDFYRRKYHTAAKTIQRLKKDISLLPMPSASGIKKRAPRNFLKNLLSINLSLSDLTLKEICNKEKINIFDFYILTVCYNHDFANNNVLKRVYPWLWKSMRRIDKRIKLLADDGYLKIIPAVKLGQRNNFTITNQGRIFVEAINKRLATKIKSYGKGVPTSKEKNSYLF